MRERMSLRLSEKPLFAVWICLPCYYWVIALSPHSFKKVCSQMLAIEDFLTESETLKHRKSMCSSLAQETEDTIRKQITLLPTPSRNSGEVQGGLN